MFPGASGDYERRLKGKPWALFANLFDHGIPIIALWIDWSLNRIYVEWNQLYPNLLVFVFYGLINITYSKAKGKPVYPPLSWDSFGSWALGFACIPLAFGFYTALYYLTKCKFRKMAMHDAINYSSTGSTIEPGRSNTNTIDVEDVDRNGTDINLAGSDRDLNVTD